MTLRRDYGTGSLNHGSSHPAAQCRGDRSLFVDESKRGGYLVTAAAVLPGQRRLHFTHESDNRRKQILDVIAELHPAVTIYDG